MTTRSLTLEQATAYFGPLATWVASNGPASNPWTVRALGWMLEQVGIVAYIERSITLYS